MSSADQWRWTDDEGVQRLLRGDELRAALTDGRLKPSTLVWKRGMKSWIPARQVAELKDAIEDGPDTVRKDSPHSIGKKAMPTPSIPAPGYRSSANVLDVAALRAAGVRNPVNTLMGVGDEKDNKDNVKIPVAPKVPKMDGGWRDGAARRDRDEDTVTALVKDDEDANTLNDNEQEQPTGRRKKKTVPPPRKRSRASTIRGETLRGNPAQSRKPPPPVRARRTAPLGGAAGISRTLKPPKRPTHPSIPPPVGSSEVLSERFSSKKHGKDAATLVQRADRAKVKDAVDKSRAKSAAKAGAKQGSKTASKSAGPNTKPPFRSTPSAIASTSTAPAPLPRRTPSAAGEDDTLPDPNVIKAATDAAAKGELRPRGNKSGKPPGTKSPMAKTGPLPESVAEKGEPPFTEEVWTGNKSSVSAKPPSEPRPALTIPTDIPPKPPMIAGLTLKYPIVAGIGAAALIAVALSFFFGRVSAPAQSNLSGAVRAKTGWAIVPLFARTRAQTAKDPRPCLMLRAPSRFAPNATRYVPIEVATGNDGRIAVGFAQNAGTARGVLVDPVTGKSEMVFEPDIDKDLDAAIERVVPLVGSGEVTFGVTKDSAEGLYRSVYVPAPTPFVVGFDSENVLKASGPGESAERIWSLAEGVGRADSLRIAKADGVGFPLTYRQKPGRGPGFVYYAMLDEGGSIAHQALPLSAPDGEVGKPNIAFGNGAVSVVFAHRQKADGARWELRWARGPVSEPLKDAALVDIPAGGPGGDAGAPAITPLSGGRWLLMWMEGTSGARTIRAQTYDRKYRPLGEALRVSPETGNFGQGVVGVVGEKGVIVFLLETAGEYEVWGTVLQCQ